MPRQQRGQQRTSKPDDSRIVGTHNGQPITAKQYREMMEQEERDMEASTEYGEWDYTSPSDADPGL